ncbi:MAG TPA: alpha-amylase domain-containing protein, partial [Ginsengibacter sp.]
IMQRCGNDIQKGLVFVLNNSATWNGCSINTQWINTRFVPIAWCGKDNTNTPEEKWTDELGRSEFWAPPRGYVVYGPA